MLETEEVDVDYFTPSTCTSLSRIFGGSSKEEDTLENNSLKYNPPLPPQTAKTEEPKTTQFLFAKSVYAYEWVNNSYEFRGRLGFAIFNIKNIDVHKMVIYDSNKTRLSCLTITQEVLIKVNEKISMSYYDDQRKFWSVNSSTSKIEEILEILQSLNVNLEFVPSIEGTEKKVKEITELSVPKLIEDGKESDTDVSFNRKTKDSILKRMANMGQSVLPPPHVAIAQTSDSSDTNIPQNQRKSRHKPKVVNKKSPLEKKTLGPDKMDELETKKVILKPEILPEIPFQIVPINTTTNNDIISSIDKSTKSSSVELLISEQRVSNSEVRINVSRMADKLDILLNKVKDLEVATISKSSNNNSQFQIEIIQKLLNEYEKKINKYEEFIKLKGFDCNTFELTSETNNHTNQKSRNTEMEDTGLQLLCNEKDQEIIQLKNELQLYSKKENQFRDTEKSLLKEINDLKYNLNVKEDCALKETYKLDDTVKQNINITEKLKQIMNDTFQAISVNFDDEQMYTGSKIKSVVGLVVKKTTIDSLKEF